MPNARMILILAVVLCLAATASAQWGSAVLEPVVSGTTNDELGHSAVAIDDQGTLHIVFDRITGGDHDFYYTQKLLGGSWIDPVPVGDPGASLLTPYLAAHKPSGTAYLVYLENGLLKLGLANDCNWVYYDLAIPYAEPLYDPCVAVDADGYAHIAVIIEHLGEFKMGYGYWDGPGTNNFYFQIIEDSQLGGFGSGASPDICVRSDGSVAISYRGGGYLMYQIDIAENASLGGTAWSIQMIEMSGYQCYSSSIKTTPSDDLHLAFHGNMGFMFPNDVYYTSKPAGSTTWPPPVEATGTTSGGDVKMAIEDDGTAHVVYMETSGNFYTGNILYTTNQSGSWAAQNLLQTNKYYPSLVMDPQGNGSLVFQEELAYQDNDVYYYGYVAPMGPPPELAVTLIPESTPVVIPVGGGWFDYTVIIANVGASTAVFDGWTEVEIQSGPTISPIILRQNLSLATGDSIYRDLTQYVPPNTPGGNHTFRLNAGYFPGTVVDSDEFLIVKPMPDDASAGGTWAFSGWEEESQAITPVGSPSQHRLAGCYPNPFNPETTLRYDVAEYTRVELAVFDLQGRKVASLANRFEDAGSHTVTWSGAQHPAGVYFARLIAGDSAPQVIKMVLMK